MSIHHKIFQAINGDNYIDTFNKDKSEFIKSINSQSSFNERWERLKYYLGSKEEEKGFERLKDALRATGSVNFYKISFSERRSSYMAVVERLSQDYGDIIDGYYKNVRYLLEFAAESQNRELYIKFIKSQLTKYELIIIFYLVAARENEVESNHVFHDLGVIDELLTMDCQSLMIDFPTVETLKIELNNIFKKTK